MTKFWKITHIVVPETIGFFDFIVLYTADIAQNNSQIFL